MGKNGLFPIILLILGAATKDAVAERPLRIVGGLTASEGEFPFVVSLRYDGAFDCGGSIISDKHILTAAHCVKDRTADRFIVRSGTIFRERPGKDHYVSYIAQHPIFNEEDPETFGYDVAVLTLRAPIVMDNMHSIIPLATSDTPGGALAQVIGWGFIHFMGPSSEVQQKLEIHTISNEECQSRVDEGVDDKHICTLEMPGLGACMGDSGGPLVYNNEVVGIASWAIPCARGVPDVYVKVYSHLDYIKNAMLNNP